MSTTMEILAATERRLQDSVETCAELREKLAWAGRDQNALLAKCQKAVAVAVALQWERDAAARERDAAGAIVERTRHLRAVVARRRKDVEAVSRWRLDSLSVLVAIMVLLLVLLALGVR